MAEPKCLQKGYLICSEHFESAELVVIEAVEEGSTPQSVRTLVLRLSRADFKNFGAPPAGTRFRQTLETMPEG